MKPIFILHVQNTKCKTGTKIQLVQNVDGAQRTEFARLTMSAVFSLGYVDFLEGFQCLKFF
jgi:hypothetical protein